jgi:hypothetical protein
MISMRGHFSTTPLQSTKLPTPCLAEMLLNIPVEDKDHFAPLGEASVCMPLRVMEKYLYPTMKLMQHLHEKGDKDLPGGIQTMAMYSFYLQGQLYPKQRAQEDLEVLKAATLTADHELCSQVRSEVQQVDNAQIQMRNVLYNLQILFFLTDSFVSCLFS